MRPESNDAAVIYERTLRLRRGDEIVPFSVRLQSMRPRERGRPGEVEADLIVDGLGSKLDFCDDGPFRRTVCHVDRLGCILGSIVELRLYLEPIEEDVRWCDDDEFGSFFVPLFIDADHFGLVFARAMQDLVRERQREWMKEHRMVNIGSPKRTAPKADGDDANRVIYERK